MKDVPIIISGSMVCAPRRSSRGKGAEATSPSRQAPLQAPPDSSAEMLRQLNYGNFIQIGLFDFVGDLLHTLTAVVRAIDHKRISLGGAVWQHRLIHPLYRNAEFGVVQLSLQDDQEMGGLRAQREKLQQLRLPRDKARKRPVRSDPDPEGL